MKKSPVWIPIFSGFLVTVAYALRRVIQIPVFDTYYSALIVIPIILILLKKFSFGELGVRIGKPLTGIFFVLLLPTILFFRWKLMGRPFHLPDLFLTIAVGSVAEEFFFRGYLQEEFKKQFKGNFWLGLLVSNLFFALVHFVKGYSLAATLMTGWIGAYFGIAKDKQGGDSLIYSALAHILFNLVAISVPQVF